MSLLTHMYKEELNVGKSCSFPTLFPIFFYRSRRALLFYRCFCFFEMIYPLYSPPKSMSIQFSLCPYNRLTAETTRKVGGGGGVRGGKVAG